ncbi:sensor domain-containing diguanylate cyclase [uncultured Alteromonas sp.]|jgi:diguanylate cyclase (GGDEF)-like protein|uniref:sensor domain-containing diguanylate cyclase n=1 Tax=uncultured Alteromonas sp. TaxID=179113 RepID=UPI0025D46D91|nr:sensor domain-containing diguanylate cyclase [uncultured Alteromonas sp.]
MPLAEIEYIADSWQDRCHKLTTIVDMQTSIAKVGMDLTSVMQIIVKHCLVLVQCDGAAIEFKEGKDMVYRATSGVAEPFLGHSIPVDSSLSGFCLQTGKVQLCNDVTVNRRANQAACAEIGVASMLLIPLHHHDHTVGVLKVFSHVKHHFTSRDTAALKLVSEQLAATLYYCHRFVADNLVYQATHDSMTNLFNRSAFMEQLNREHSLGVSYPGRKFGILIIDMNGLKSINDELGHRAGDSMLSELARRLLKAFRPADKVARIGGDEFGVLMTNIHSEGTIKSISRRFEQSLASEFEFEGSYLNLSVSIGWAVYPDNALTLNELLDIADAHMYKNKNAYYMGAHI